MGEASSKTAALQQMREASRAVLELEAALRRLRLAVGLLGGPVEPEHLREEIEALRDARNRADAALRETQFASDLLLEELRRP